MLFKFNQKYRLLIMRRHEFALCVSTTSKAESVSIEIKAKQGDTMETHNRPLLKLDIRSGMLLRSTHISGVRI